MRFSPAQAALWILLYLALAILPVIVAYAGTIPDARGFWVEFGVALGFVGLAMMSLQFVLTGRFQHVAGTLGLDSMLQFHRQIGLVAFVLILAHPIILILADSQYLAFFDPRENLPRSFALVSVIGALVLIVVSTLWREALRLPYEWWRAVHGVLALFIVFVGVVHVLQVGFYVSTWWKQAIWILATGAAMVMLVNTRIIRPMQMKGSPYRVSEVREERGRAWTLALEPDSHPGFRFREGQFGWLILGESAFSFRQHPFSFSSSADLTGRIEMTIKDLGDFSSRVGETPVGTTAYLEGPFGAFVPSRDSDRGMVCIAGGVGITPIMSMLRTFADREDPRGITLVYGSPRTDEILFFEDIERLRTRLNLTVVYVISEPVETWKGERGLITPDLLDRCLPTAERASYEYFVCGPEPMMDAVEPYLRERGVPLRNIFAERFKIV
jgi:predicted ferric reductase